MGCVLHLNAGGSCAALVRYLAMNEPQEGNWFLAVETHANSEPSSATPLSIHLIARWERPQVHPGLGSLICRIQGNYRSPGRHPARHVNPGIIVIPDRCPSLAADGAFADGRGPACS